MPWTIRDIKIGVCWLTILTLIALISNFVNLKISEADVTSPTTQVTVTSADPVVSNVVFHNNDWDITLNEWDGENGTTTATTTFTITDANGYADIATATLVIYSTTLDADQSCASSTQACYRYDDFSWALSNDNTGNCAQHGNDGSNEAYFWCTTSLQFFATPTDTGSENENSQWAAYVTTTDLAAGAHNASSSAIQVITLQALNLSTTSITYPSLGVNASSGNLWSTTTATTTGNVAIDIHFDGGNLTKSGDDSKHIAAFNQRFTTSSGIWYYTEDDAPAWLSTTTDETDVGKTHDVTIKRATTTPPTGSSADEIYWGVYIPSGTAAGTYASSTNFTATSTIVNP